MATRQQVLSLFGATPAQIQERQRQQQQEFLAAQRTPEQLAGGAIGVGLARLFSGKSPEMQVAEQMQEAVKGVDVNNPAALRELATTVANFAPEQALQIATYAGQLEKTQMGEVVSAPLQVGTKPIYKQEFNEAGLPTGKYIVVGQEPVFRDVPHKRTAGGLTPLVNYGVEKTEAAPSAPAVPQETIPDFIPDPNNPRMSIPNPAKITVPSTQQITPTVSPEAAERIGMQTGARGGGLGTYGTVAPPPTIQGETQYNPAVLQEEIDALQAQLNSLPRTSKARKELQKEINKRKAKIRTSSIPTKKSRRNR